MTDNDIKLLALLYLKGPQWPSEIQMYQSKALVAKGFAYWMPCEKKHALTITDNGKAFFDEAIRIFKENCSC